jgi:hypothetical protein
MGTRVQALDWPLAGTGERGATVRELQSLIIATRVGKLQGTLALRAAAPCSQQQGRAWDFGGEPSAGPETLGLATAGGLCWAKNVCRQTESQARAERIAMHGYTPCSQGGPGLLDQPVGPPLTAAELLLVKTRSGG